MEQKAGYEPTLILLSYFFLVVIGIIEVWSSSRYFAYRNFNDPNLFLRKEIFYAAVSLSAALFFSIFNHKILKKLSFHLVVLSLFLLLLLHIGFGIEVRGATRWLKLGIQFEPSQFAQLVVLIYIADFISRKEEFKDSARGVMPVSFVVGLFFILIALEPDVGTAFLVLLTFAIVIYVAGYSAKYILSLLFPSLFVLGMIIYTYPEKLSRLMNFFVNNKINYQVEQSLIALGSGGFFGHGIGDGNYKSLFVPDSYNDFILAGIGEDFGFFGICVVILLLMLIFYSIFSISKKSNDTFSKILSFGIGVTLVVQVLINLFSVLNLIPPKGITMPFLSYGGTSLVMQGVMIGIVLNIYRNKG